MTQYENILLKKAKEATPLVPKSNGKQQASKQADKNASRLVAPTYAM